MPRRDSRLPVFVRARPWWLWATLLFCTGTLTLLAAHNALRLPTFHLDGAFQTASGLYRLADGQLPGRDFFPYLGLGPIALLMPIFWLLGGDLFASTTSAWAMTFIGAGFALSVMYRIVLGRSVLESLAAGLLLATLGALLTTRFDLWLLEPLMWALEPGNSLRPLRALVPYLALAAYLWASARATCWRNRAFGAAAIAGLAFGWSNDFGIPTAFGVLALFWLDSPRVYRGAMFGFPLLFALFVGALFLILATGGHQREWLAFNFKDVAGDQWWYYGPYSNNARIFSPGDLVRLLRPELALPVLLLGITAGTAWRKRNRKALLLSWLGAVTLLAGVLASVGGHIGGYFGPFKAWALALVLLFALSFVGKRIHVPMSYRRVVLPGISLALLIGTLAWYNQDARSLRQPGSGFVPVPELGGYLPEAWTPALAYWRGVPKGDVLFEEYWGIASALRRSFPPVPVDSVIHALGSLRPKAQQQLDLARHVVTTRASLSDIWHSWNVTQNYWFYQDLLEHWQPEFMTPTTVVWTRMDTPREVLGPAVACRYDARLGRVEPGPLPPGPYQLTLTYEVSSGRPMSRVLLMLRNNVSFGAGAVGKASLDPNGRTAVLPVYHREPGTWFDLSVRGGDLSQVQVHRCELRPFRLPKPLAAAVPLRDFPRYQRQKTLSPDQPGA